MKFDVINKEKIVKPFPKLMINDKNTEIVIILATKSDDNYYTGTCIFSEDISLKVGSFYDKWIGFRDFEGSIKLSND